MTSRVELISTVPRRRRWTAEEKVTILDEAFWPGGSVAAAADRHDVSRALICLWRRKAREGGIPGVSVSEAAPATFVPARIEESTPSAPPAALVARARRRSGLIEIALCNGRVVKVEEGVDPGMLGRIVAALDGGA
jgi:transposase